MSRPKLIIFASGTATGGGSGFENLATSPDLDANIVAVVSNHEHGGARERAERLGIPFIYFECRTSDVRHPMSLIGEYRDIVKKSGAEWVALSGWLKHVQGLDPSRTFNIHPALLSFDHGRFGGPGMYGHHLHEAVKAALDAGEITESGFTMHFVTDTVDGGPVFFEHRVPLEKGMSAETIAAAVNKAEHQWQPKITNMVVHGQIRWDGKDPATLEVPAEFK
ncbi:MAG TPA: formyltransferase family protein [Candidatus Paceibacterota bacterium]